MKPSFFRRALLLPDFITPNPENTTIRSGLAGFCLFAGALSRGYDVGLARRTPLLKSWNMRQERGSDFWRRFTSFC
jgi:hypothetical protein